MPPNILLQQTAHAICGSQDFNVKPAWAGR
jgi:hypothetical protein